MRPSAFPLLGIVVGAKASPRWAGAFWSNPGRLEGFAPDWRSGETI